MQTSTAKTFFSKKFNLTKNATTGIINASSNVKTRNSTVFATGRTNFTMLRNFFEEKLDIISPMWYTINT